MMANLAFNELIIPCHANQENTSAQKMETADFVTFTKEILNGKLHFL